MEYINSNIICAAPSMTVKLLKGTKIIFRTYITVSQTPENDNSYFSITLNSSIDISTWNLYETWKEQDESRLDVSFDEWIETLFKQSDIQALQDKVDSLEQTVQNLKTIIEG